MSVVGRAYAEGRLSVNEVAALLERSVPDAVALLEKQGYRRTVDKLRLTQEEEARMLEKIRAERIARGGKPHVEKDLVQRDVIASQRIEGIDARPWVR